MNQYSGWLCSVGLEPGVKDLDSLWLQDDHYLLLYNAEIAGNEEVLKALVDELSTLNLEFPSWFKPFNTAYEIPRPTSEAKLRRINGG